MHLLALIGASFLIVVGIDTKIGVQQIEGSYKGVVNIIGGVLLLVGLSWYIGLLT